MLSWFCPVYLTDISHGRAKPISGHLAHVLLLVVELLTPFRFLVDPRSRLIAHMTHKVLRWKVFQVWKPGVDVGEMRVVLANVPTIVIVALCYN